MGDEYTINHINQPSDYITTSPTALATTAVFSSNHWFKWDVTSAVKSTLDNKASSSNMLTLVLADKQYSTGMPIFEIASREAGIIVTLYIQWNVPAQSTSNPNPITTSPEPTLTTTTPSPTSTPIIPAFPSTILLITFLLTATLLGTVVIKRKQSIRRR